MGANGPANETVGGSVLSLRSPHLCTCSSHSALTLLLCSSYPNRGYLREGVRLIGSSHHLYPTLIFYRRDLVNVKVMPAVTSVEKAKRVRRRQSRLNINDALSSMVDVHDVAYWSQWRLAIHGVCAQFEAAAQVEVDAWSRERVDHVSISRQQALSSEIRHLEAQLGKHTSMNAKLEAASFENANALAKTESARVTAAAAVTRLQVG